MASLPRALASGANAVACVLLMATVTGCSESLAPRPWSRDVAKAPIVVTSEAPGMIYAVSDVHGGFERLTALLARYGLITAGSSAPTKWAGGDAALVVVGDLIDKGPQSLEVVDLLRALQPQAIAAGGRVIVTLGNHEAEWLADPENSKASKSDGIDSELSAMGLDPELVSTVRDPRGLWLGDLPFAARVGNWFFAHAGNTGGATIDALSAKMEHALEINGFTDPAIIGDASILEAQDWYGDPQVVAHDLAAVDAKHFVVGHDPHALGPEGAIAVSQAGTMFRIDCGMSPDVDYSQGALLRIRHTPSEDVVDSLAADGTVQELWRGAP